MKHHIGKQVSAMLAVVLTVLACWAGAAPAHAAQPSSGTEVPAAVAGMDRYIHEEDGTLFFDATGAYQDGYAAATVDAVADRIDEMNRLLGQDGAYLAEDGTVIVENIPSGATMFRAARARGVNKTVAHWWGVTEYWVDSNQANKLINALKKGQAGVKLITGFLPIGGFLKSVSNAYMAGLAANAASAARAGKGIIMYTRPIVGSTTMQVWFGPQP